MRIRVYKRGLLILLFAFAVLYSEAQLSYQLHKSRNENSWFISGSLGLTSYLGDLARFNFDPIYKYKEESKFAFTLAAGKSFNQIYSARAFFLSGGLKAYDNPHLIRYDAKLTSYGLQFLINFNTLIGKMNYVPDVFIYGIAGAGSTSTKPMVYHISNDSINNTPIDSLNYAENISTFDVNFGLGVNLSILRNFDAFAEIVYHYTMSDELDLVVGEKKDAFFHTLVGIRYRFAFAGNKGSSIFGRKRR